MNYGEELSAAWADHLRPRQTDAPTVVSLFAGAGGSSLGYSMAGFREPLAVEWDRHAVACLRRNLPGVVVHYGDVSEVRPDSIPLTRGSLDVLDGSPPCQGFSTAGKRLAGDSRNQLFHEYVRLLRAWMPRCFVVENVAGMGTGVMRPIFREIMGELRGSGYRVRALEMIASYYRVPQRRKRMIIIGVRDDLDVEPSHPKPMSAEITVRQALAGMESIGKTVDFCSSLKRLAPHIHPGGNAKKVLIKHGKKGNHYGFNRLDYDAPSMTLLKSSGNRVLHPRFDRVLGTRELSRLQSFPDEYDWGDSGYNQIQERIGNSVPPLLMRAVATHLRSLVM